MFPKGFLLMVAFILSSKILFLVVCKQVFLFSVGKYFSFVRLQNKMLRYASKNFVDLCILKLHLRVCN